MFDLCTSSSLLTQKKPKSPKYNLKKIVKPKLLNNVLMSIIFLLV
jgi:hypothetical protein